MSENLPAVVQHHTELSVEVVIDRLSKIHELMRKAMTQDIDFGIIPGTGSKPTLLKPGAEKLCLMFRLCPEYKTVKHWDGNHLTVECSCRILGQDGNFLGEANAMASTREKKWAYRNGERVCPECSKPAIIKGKAEYGGGWVCFKKKDGCGAKFRDGDQAIEGQQVGRVDNPDLADTYNTVLRIAEKRAYIAAVRLVTGSSALFDEEHGPAEREPQEEPVEQQVSPRVQKERDVQDMLSKQGKTLASMLKWLQVDPTTQLSGLSEQQLQAAYMRLKEAPKGKGAA